jgi:hypothetical protein
MNWKAETWDDYIARKTTWHKWFAWYPVEADGRFYWLETVLRQGTPSGLYDGHWFNIYKPFRKNKR